MVEAVEKHPSVIYSSVRQFPSVYLLKGHSPLDLGPPWIIQHDLLARLQLNYIHKDLFFPNKVTFTDSGNENMHLSFGEPVFNPKHQRILIYSLPLSNVHMFVSGLVTSVPRLV